MTTIRKATVRWWLKRSGHFICNYIKCFANVNNPFFVLKQNKLFRNVHGEEMRIKSPIKYLTPYGGRLEWILPGGNQLIVHLKDRKKVRIKKRWSQVWEHEPNTFHSGIYVYFCVVQKFMCSVCVFSFTD